MYSCHIIIITDNKGGIALRVNRHLLDMKTGDVTGDGIVDTVYLYGDLKEVPHIYAENIFLEVRDGRTNSLTVTLPEINAGYNPRLFLGEISMGKQSNIMISFITGDYGEERIFYIYSFKDNNLIEIFNSAIYNAKYTFQVNYQNHYKVRIDNAKLNKFFLVDIRNKKHHYISKYYEEDGKLRKPVHGKVLVLSSLFPIIINQTGNKYDLLGLQRIIGTTQTDTLGYIENLLTWNGNEFVSFRLALSMPYSKLNY